jgi:hypothetical protein
MNKDTLYREVKRLLVDMPPCVDGGYEFACNSCVAQALSDWAERIYQQGREDVALAALATISTTLSKASA